MMRKRHDKEFKATVALEAIKGEKTLHEIAAQYEVNPQQISLWKKEMMNNAGEIFAKKSVAEKELEQAKIHEEELYKQIGKLNVEKDFLKKKYRQLYGKDPD